MKAKLSKLSKTFIIVGCILACLFVAVMIYYFGASYPEFEKLGAQAFEIPGLETNFVPQGLTYDQTNDNFLVCGYMGDSSPSRIYVVDKETGKTLKHVTLLENVDESKSDYCGHAGGIAVSYPNIFISGDGYVYNFSYDEMLSAKDGDKISILNRFKTDNGADFLTIIDDTLVVGEFYRESNYPTPESHHITIEDETNRALSFVYRLNESEPCGFDTEILYAISMTDQIQGMCFNKNGDIVLSSSYGLANSILYVYQNILAGEPQSQVQLGENTVNVYFLGQSNLIETYTEVPCMSEEIVLVDDKIHVLFESNCKKYRLVTRTRMSHVYCLDI